MHGIAGEALAIGSPGVVLGLLDRLPTEDRHELMRGGAVVGGDGRTGLAKTVGGAVIEGGLVAAVAEPVSEAVGGERSSELGDE